MRTITMTDSDASERENGHVGPIIFANEFARRQLVDHGEVITFRGDRTVGETWWTDEYGTKRNGYCTVERIEAIEPTQTNLAQYHELSGFPSTVLWMDAIDDLHDDGAGYLYRVTERDPDE